MVAGNSKKDASGLKYILILFFFISSFGIISCEFSEHTFIHKKQLTYLDEANKTLYYSLYKVGIDNYNYDLFVSDSIYIGSLYLNDATYKNVIFNVNKMDSIIIINCNYSLASKVDEFHYSNYRIIVKKP